MCQAYLRYWSYSNQQNRNSCPLCIYLFREKNPVLSLSSPPSLLVYIYFLQASSIPVSLEEWKAAAGLPVFLWNLMGDSEVLCLPPLWFIWDSDLFQWRGITDWEEMEKRGDGTTSILSKNTILKRNTCYCEGDKAFRHVGNASGCTQLN